MQKNFTEHQEPFIAGQVADKERSGSETKTCSKCKRVLPRSADYFHRSKSNDFKSRCKSCTSIDKSRKSDKGKIFIAAEFIPDGYAACIKCKQVKEKSVKNYRKSSISRNPKAKHIVCKECRKKREQKQRSKNREKINENHARWRKENREKHNLTSREWKRKNKEKVAESIRSYQKRRSHVIRAAKKRRYKKDPDKYRLKSRMYLKRRKESKPPWFEADKVRLIYKMAMKYKLEVDHIVPLSGDNVCGLHCWHNLQLLDRHLNASKNNKHWPDM